NEQKMREAHITRRETSFYLFMIFIEKISNRKLKHSLCHSVWLFHLHSTVKRQAFSPVFPLAESIAEAFFWLSLWNFEEKSINHFLGHSLLQRKRRQLCRH
ncbi:hypothetical protein, partial [uncultured Bilophila sp.]|uniref:hypothetical protein n=1 Tax=uncultured Bilophila sp. TaxID=529385 RepID=UPI0026703989